MSELPADGKIVLKENEQLIAVLPFAPGFGEGKTRWILSAPALQDGKPNNAEVHNWKGEVLFKQQVGPDVKLTREYAVQGELIGVAEWVLRCEEIVAIGRGVRYDGYIMEG